IEKERLNFDTMPDEPPEVQIRRMVAKGLRAQLKTGNLLTGQLFVDVDFFQDVEAAAITTYKGLSVLPSIPAASQRIVQDIASIAATLNKLPLEEIGQSLQSSLAGLDRLINDPALQNVPANLAQTLAQLETLASELNGGTLPEVNTTLKEVNDLVMELEALFSADSPLHEDLSEVLREIANTARSITDLADLLERHPEALLQGKNIGADE
ncbi:MAG: hypothetical protein D6B25_05460, partial [Desulfobulbaceae bacterium]